MQTTDRFEGIRQQLEEQRNQLRTALENEESANNNSHTPNLDRTELVNQYRSQGRHLALRTIDQQKLTQIEEALAQIEAGTYGQCANCHQSINAERMEILPYATLCIECQEEAFRQM